MKRMKHLLMLVALLALSTEAWSEDCHRRTWVSFLPTDGEPLDVLGPFEHVMLVTVDGKMALLAHTQSVAPSEAPLITIATYDSFLLLWSYSYGKKSGTSDAAVFWPYDPSLPTHTICVPAQR